MARKRRRLTPEFKVRAALEALREHYSVQAVAARHELHPNQVRTRKRQLLIGLMGMEATYRRPRTSVANLEYRISLYLLRGM